MNRNSVKIERLYRLQAKLQETDAGVELADLLGEAIRAFEQVSEDEEARLRTMPSLAGTYVDYDGQRRDVGE